MRKPQYIQAGAYNTFILRSQSLTIDRFLDVPDAPARSLVVVNRTDPEPFQQMLENLFADQEVDIEETVSEEFEDNTVLLLEDGEVIAQSTFESLQNTLLMVNSDLFKTGTQKLEETEVPAVIDGLSGTQFELQGYPESDTETLLLILISRHIERQAFEHGAGTLRSSFQRLSRIVDEQGTRRVYERVAETDIDVHLYGQPDWTPDPEFSVTIHGGYDVDFRRSWFVLYNPPEVSTIEPTALLAIETGERAWEGFWTDDESIISELSAYIRRNL